MTSRTNPNVLLVSHCDFFGNSAYHALALARMFRAQGINPAIAIPDNLASFEVVGQQSFVITTYAHALRGEQLFGDRAKPDIIHAFTPREHVRKFTEALSAQCDCPYVVHFEDNERIIVEDEIGKEALAALDDLPPALTEPLIAGWRSHPQRANSFVERASGLTAVIDRLLDGVPPGIPRTVFWPGFDEGARDNRGAGSLRTDLGIAADEIVLVYTGNLHASNVSEMRSLYLAVALLRRGGYPARLVRTGHNHTPAEWLQELELGDAVLDLGFLTRSKLWQVLQLADILVQPGAADDFNEYRFPSKLPDFLVSGKPVVLPRSNIGRQLIHAENALLLDRGDAEEIFDMVATLADDASLRQRIGEAGKAFAETYLRWDHAAAKVSSLYCEVLDRGGDGAGWVAVPAAVEPDVKLIAFYLPQFHPIEENDEWWGEGFTEWTNVRAGRPAFRGHYQPQVPYDGGYYDLRDPLVLDQQAALAKAYGIYGFCYYYYWFDGRRVLDLPLNQMIKRGEPNMPFCYCWANENWTRRWDGLDEEILLQQTYSGDWAERFMEDLLPVLSDSRYIHVRDRPLLLVYRANLIPNVRAATETWRSVARGVLGKDIHLAAVQSFGIDDPRPFGFDSAVEFPPHTERFLLEHAAVEGVVPDFAGYLEDYVEVAMHQVARDIPEYEWFRGVMPSWDNTARRRSRAHILVGSNPEQYEEWLRKIVFQTALRRKIDEPFIFLNAWNEWAEGTHLEPDTLHGYGWLSATQRALHDGVSKYHELVRQAVARTVADRAAGEATSIARDTPSPPADGEGSPALDAPARNERRTVASGWFSERDLERVVERYATYSTEPLSYATVGDFVDSYEHLRPLSTAQGDLKDVQRPWAVKAVLSNVPRGGRILEIGAGQPFVADLLARCGYDVWVVDPYDGSGNGPVDFDRFRDESPTVTFVRDEFSDRLDAIAPSDFDCVYSISVLEHIDENGLDAVIAGMLRAMKPSGISIHAVDHVLSGKGSDDHLARLKYLTVRHGDQPDRLESVLSKAMDDPDTYFLSAESHNRWRGDMPYHDFPMRKCISVHLVAPTKKLGGARNGTLRSLVGVPHPEQAATAHD